MIFYPTPTTPTTLKSSVVGVVGAGSFFVSQFRIICFILRQKITLSVIIPYITGISFGGVGNDEPARSREADGWESYE